MTDAEARVKVAQTIRREALTVMQEFGDAKHAPKIADAFAKMSTRIIDHYLLYIFQDTDQKGRAS